MLTIFGKKGKKEEEKTEKAAFTQQPTSNPFPPPTKTPDPNIPGHLSASREAPPVSGSKSDENSLSELLRSLLQDVPLTTTSEDTKEVPGESTSEWVPPLTSPPSRKMVIVEDNKGERTLAAFQSDESKFYPVSSPSELERDHEFEEQPEPMKPVATPSPIPKNIVADRETSKPSKPDKPERPEPASKVAAPPRPEPVSDRLSQLTAGGLDSPGLVVIEGTEDSKTSLVLNLTSKYLAAGADCLLVSYDRPIPILRDNIKNAGWNANEYESGFHLLLFDAFSSQTDSLSMEPYYIEKPFDIDNLSATLERHTQMMMTSRIQVIIDSITGLASRSTKDFPAKLRTFSENMKGHGSTVIITVDPAKLPKDTVASLEETATCVIEVQGDGRSGQLKVKKVNGASSKLKPEEFEIQPGKGLLFT